MKNCKLYPCNIPRITKSLDFEERNRAFDFQPLGYLACYFQPDFQSLPGPSIQHVRSLCRLAMLRESRRAPGYKYGEIISLRYRYSYVSATYIHDQLLQSTPISLHDINKAIQWTLTKQNILILSPLKENCLLSTGQKSLPIFLLSNFYFIPANVGAPKNK